MNSNCPSPDELKIYAHGGENLAIAEHISECRACALAVAEEMTSFENDPAAEVIDVTPKLPWWRRFFGRR